MHMLLELIGKFHPLLLHIPIGVLIYCYLQWAYDYTKKTKKPVDLKLAFSLGVISSIASAISGYLLGQGGGYDDELLRWHQYLGIGTALASVVIYYLYRINHRSVVFGLTFTLFIALLGITGHYGGSLTHGKDFLSVSSVISKPDIADPNQAHLFEEIVMPIIRAKCVSCHNPQKSKGDLLLYDLDGWQAGGKNGSILTAGVPSQSSLITRIHLPVSDEKHMPPDGKVQLSEDEKHLLDWWVTHMKNYDQIVSDLPPDAEVQAYLETLVNDVEAGLPEIDQDMITQLQKEGWSISPLSQGSKWLDVSTTNVKVVTSRNLKSLKVNGQNILSLDLSNKKIKDKDIRPISAFENLKELNLSNTDITDEAIESIIELFNLEVINLYGTSLSDEGLHRLLPLPKLQKVYLWNSKVTASALGDVRGSHPDIKFIHGVDQSNFEAIKLISPEITTSQELFEDTLSVSIKSSSKRGVIRYTTDGSIPNESSTQYIKPFTIDKTSVVKAVMTLEGWETSESVEKTFTKVRYQVADIKLDKQPSPKYSANGPSTLTDMEKASTSFGDGKWLGYEKSHFTAFLDLGKVEDVTGLIVGSLFDHRSYIFPPVGIKASISSDGKTYLPFASTDIPPPTEQDVAQKINYLIKGETTSARYIKLKIESPLINPKWHSAPGAPSWVFVDEIVVE